MASVKKSFGIIYVICSFELSHEERKNSFVLNFVFIPEIKVVKWPKYISIRFFPHLFLFCFISKGIFSYSMTVIHTRHNRVCFSPNNIQLQWNRLYYRNWHIQQSYDYILIWRLFGVDAAFSSFPYRFTWKKITKTPTHTPTHATFIFIGTRPKGMQHVWHTLSKILMFQSGDFCIRINAQRRFRFYRKLSPARIL